MGDIKNKEERSRNMSAIRGTDTKPEILVRKYLYQYGFRFRKNDPRYPGTPDIVLPKYKTVVFINGCFWHRHQNCKYAYIPKSNSDFWMKKFDANVGRDIKNYEMLKNDGWQVIVIWECELRYKESRERTLEELKRKLLSSV